MNISSGFALLVAVPALAGCAGPLHAGQPAAATFRIGESDFLFDGRPFVIRSGEMHAARVPRDYWRHRLQMVRAMGCNTVCAYLFWNQHEPRAGEFDFSGQADVAEYCRLAHEAGLKVILRPGPYSCAEWDLGGFPWWLLKTPDIRLRTRDPRYLEPMRRYLARVGRELAPLQITRGGPIIMVQVENEYGSYGDDRAYIGEVRDALVSAGFDVPLFTCDGPSQLKNDVREDVFSVVNFGSEPEAAFKALREVRAAGPLMCGEYYPGWFDTWGKPHHTGDSQKIVADLAYMLEHRASFSIYMVHGGTSFGFSAGANSPPFAPQSTSYDYDAPIDEAGRPTPKFHAIRELFARHLGPGESLPEIPTAPNPIITIPPMEFREAASLFLNLGKPRREERLRPMELLDQPHGAILYRTTLHSGPEGTLTITKPHDLARVYIDSECVGAMDRRRNETTLTLPAREKPARLDILVEAMGRVNYGSDLHDRKGITEKVEFTAEGKTSELTGWEVYSFPFDAAHLKTLKRRPVSHPIGRPALYHAAFELKEVGDTFLDLRAWSKGMVWVNGHNLGRYWRIGPQQALYLPGCWLKAGRNDIEVLDIDGGAERLVVEGLAAPILDETMPVPQARP